LRDFGNNVDPKSIVKATTLFFGDLFSLVCLANKAMAVHPYSKVDAPFEGARVTLKRLFSV